MIELSAAQEAIVLAIERGENVIVSSTAGTGKSTVSMEAARRMPDKRFLLVTYNRHLKQEMIGKCADIKNIAVMNHHGIAVRYYDSSAHKDEVIDSVLDNHTRLSQVVFPAYDVVIIDECQDLNKTYYRLARDYMRRLPRAQIVFIGDAKQTLYQFSGADDRYLTLAAQIWPERVFTVLDLPESRRITHNIAQFLNINLFGYQHITSKKSGPRVEVLVAPMAMAHKRVMAMIQREMGVIIPEEIFVLAPSVRGKTRSILEMANYCTDQKVPIYISKNESEDLKENVTAGKVVFTTFHQSKGRERDVVVVYGMNHGYFQYYNRDIPESHWNRCPNTYYVACTRAKRLLIVVQDSLQGAVEFQKTLVNDHHVNVSGKYGKSTSNAVVLQHKAWSVTRLIKFIKPAQLVELRELCAVLFDTRCAAGRAVDINHTVPGVVAGTVEEVSDINGTAISALWEHKRQKQCTVLDWVRTRNIKTFHKSVQPLVGEMIARNTVDEISLCMAVTAYYAACDDLLYRVAQISNYTWLDHEVAEECMVYLDKYISRKAQFEIPCERVYTSKLITVPVVGRLDIMDRGFVWEIKCTSELTFEHRLQLVMYAWIMNGAENTTANDRALKYRLLNIRTGELERLTYVQEHVDRVMELIMRSNFELVHATSDETFIEHVRGYDHAHADDAANATDVADVGDDTDADIVHPRDTSDMSDIMCRMSMLSSY